MILNGEDWEVIWKSFEKWFDNIGHTVEDEDGNCADESDECWIRQKNMIAIIVEERMMLKA